ncbi:Uu.00g070940.m01.CDS01 [Anthostomella pinea]|uniref:Uu.00g070940.m01.CDS01 n=1 Tax=Anthostomella pinea TaxID=933095 RepID=A0AAI8VUT1_9PEZI|nr:Uu.00g070940.m01.CDS01 [Anthostomella pinea]
MKARRQSRQSWQELPVSSTNGSSAFDHLQQHSLNSPNSLNSPRPRPPADSAGEPKLPPPLPSWPQRVRDITKIRRRHHNAKDELEEGANLDSPDRDITPDGHATVNMAARRSRRPRFLQPASRIRRGILFVAIITAITLIVLFSWLYRDQLGPFDGLFKKTTSVKLTQGTYLGEVTQKSDKYLRAIQMFRGIPYAQTTAGANRFRPPQPLNLTAAQAQSDKAQHALAFGNICPQPGGGGSGQGEDCLNLNIYRPHFGDDPESSLAEMAKLGLDGKKIPVVVYVHGGGFNTGSGKERNMGSFVSWSETPIIAISFNYRVGAFGFLPSAMTEKEGLLNLGLKDQQCLFEWVRNNVADLGGDPDNVTIMGLSAGSHSIGHQLISYAPANKLTSGPPPFQKAIMESGAATARSVFAPSVPLYEQQFQEFLMHCGLDSVPDDKLFEQLRALPLGTISSASGYTWNRWSSSLRWPFQPVIDGPGGIIPDLPIKSWAKGNVLRIPILTGFNTNEGSVFVPTKASDSSALRRLMSSIIPALNQTDLDTLNKMYPDPTTSEGKKLYSYQPPSGIGSQFWRLDDAYAHYAYICPVLQTAHLASTAKNASPVYTYHYAARSKPYGGADHGDEAPIVAHDMDVIGKYPGLVRTAEAMTGAWTRFAATGDPSPARSSDDKTKLSWPKFVSPFTTSASGDAGKVALFGSGNDERMGARGRQSQGVPAQLVALTEREKEECRFWWDRVVLSEGYANGTATVTLSDGKVVKANL